jgi:hypothetical protein
MEGSVEWHKGVGSDLQEIVPGFQELFHFEKLNRWEYFC